jgi:hypothetical protein
VAVARSVVLVELAVRPEEAQQLACNDLAPFR